MTDNNKILIFAISYLYSSLLNILFFVVICNFNFRPISFQLTTCYLPKCLLLYLEPQIQIFRVIILQPLQTVMVLRILDKTFFPLNFINIASNLSSSTLFQTKANCAGIRRYRVRVLKDNSVILRNALNSQ